MRGCIDFRCGRTASARISHPATLTGSTSVFSPPPSTSLAHPANSPRPAQTAPRVIALAASMGGLLVLGAILAALPKDFPAPILIAQHLSPDPRSELASLLNRWTDLRVQEARQDDCLQAGCVYVTPSGRHLLDRLSLRQQGPCRVPCLRRQSFPPETCRRLPSPPGRRSQLARLLTSIAVKPQVTSAIKHVRRDTIPRCRVFQQLCR